MRGDEKSSPWTVLFALFYLSTPNVRMVMSYACTECSCGTTVPDVKWRVNTCKTPCKGDNSVACGGTDSINVYKWGHYPSEDSSEDSSEESPDIYYPEPEKPRLSVGTVYGARSRGCFRDSARGRVLDGHEFKSDTMTAQVRQGLYRVLHEMRTITSFIPKLM